MKRKLIAICFALSMLFGLTSCSAPGSNVTSPSGDISDTDTPESGSAMGAVVPCPLNMTPSAENTYPYMGTTLLLPQPLLDAVLDNIVFMRANEDVEYTDISEGNSLPMDWRPTAENTILHSASIEFLFLTEDMRERAPRRGMENPLLYDEYLVWITNALPMARLDMYQKSDFQETMLEANDYTEHTKLGESTGFVYYLSFNPATDDMNEEARLLFSSVSDLEKGISVFEPRAIDDYYFGITTPEVTALSNIGAFQTTTLDGQSVDQSIFADAKLTMINVWTTWCGACIAEMPDLEIISRELLDSDMQLISIAADTYDARTGTDQELLTLAQMIKERTGISFPVLIPDSNLQERLLQGIIGYPTTWFVDNQGNLVGEPVLGSNSEENWRIIIQERLEEINK